MLMFVYLWAMFINCSGAKRLLRKPALRRFDVVGWPLGCGKRVNVDDLQTTERDWVRNQGL